MINIKTGKIKNSDISVPGSKSYTHRAMIAAALSEGQCTIYNALDSEDTRLTLSALKQMGVKTDESADRIIVHGTGGVLEPYKAPIDLRGSGTSMRLLTGVAALGKGTYTLTGIERMQERPISDLLNGLQQIGVQAKAVKSNDCPPVEVDGGQVRGGVLSLNCGKSSQFLSSLLLIAPYTMRGIDVTITEGPVSKPYIDMTVDTMSRFGVDVERKGYSSYKVSGGQRYSADSYTVEPDCSQAGYFWAAAALTGVTIKVLGTKKSSCQGDARFAQVLEAMGCNVFHEDDGIAVTGGELSGVEVNMSDMPDVVPTLAVVAAFARGSTVIKNVAHLKDKESDRLNAVASELNKIGIEATATDDGLIITGGIPRGAEIETYNDHRIAMSFAVAGLVTNEINIKDEKCVEKSFPDFWDVFGGLYQT